MADDVKAGSPLWWLASLERDLDARWRDVSKYDDYYRGEHRLLFASSKFREAFGDLFSAFADNWCPIIVDAVEERLNVEGFRFGDASSDGDAWEIWQQNGLDAMSQIAHTEALIAGEAYAAVWNSDGQPSVTVEHAGETIVRSDRATRRRLAALKRWRSDDGALQATVYLPDGLYKFEAKTGSEKWRLPTSDKDAVGWIAARASRWTAREVAGEPWPVPNPLGVVPVVPLQNRPRLLTGGESELADVIPLQDAANKILSDMLVASEFAAFPQRTATGLEIPTDPETGQPQEPFRPGVDRLWLAEDPEVKFGEFSVANLGNYVTAVELLVQHIASQTRTPPHYFALTGQYPSGESIKSAETGLVAKARRKMRHFGESWEEVLRLCFAVRGEPEKAAYGAAETIWGDPESRTEGEHVDALLKLSALGVPQQQLWEDAGYSPQQIARFRTMAAEDSLRVLLTQPRNTASPQSAEVVPPVEQPSSPFLGG